jgi:hypothetical protein
MDVAALAKAIEKMGYKSKDTAQVIRMAAGRGKDIKKSGDKIKLA